MLLALLEVVARLLAKDSEHVDDVLRRTEVLLHFARERTLDLAQVQERLGRQAQDERRERHRVGTAIGGLCARARRGRVPRLARRSALVEAPAIGDAKSRLLLLIVHVGSPNPTQYVMRSRHRERP